MHSGTISEHAKHAFGKSSEHAVKALSFICVDSPLVCRVASRYKDRCGVRGIMCREVQPSACPIPLPPVEGLVRGVPRQVD